MNLNTSADIRECLDASLSSAVVSASLELGIFWEIEKSPGTATQLARRFELSPRRCEYLLRYLTSLGLLVYQDGAFELTPTARRAIIEAFPQPVWLEIAIGAREDYASGLNLVEQLRQPAKEKPALDPLAVHSKDYIQAMVDNLDQARRFSNLLYHLHRPLAEEVVSRLSMNGERCLMDLGGGSGVLSLALLHRYPGLQAVVVDIPNVCQAGREIADATPEGSRIHYYPADFLRDPLPGSFDLVLECDVSIFTAEIFEKVRASLNPGGRFVIIDRWFENEHLTRRGHLGYLLRNSLKNPEFTIPDLKDVIDSLRAAGLVVVGCKDLPQHHWLMIESRKD